MKKNIFSVIITALTVINVILTAILFFVMLPTFQKTNNLITQVASVLNLELETEEGEEYGIEDLEYSTVELQEQTLNLAAGTDGKQHYALLEGYTLSINKDSKDYKKLNKTITENQVKITDIVRSVVQSYSFEDISEPDVKEESLKQIQKFLDSKVVVDIVLTNFRYS